jgi:hypothetical protein
MFIYESIHFVVPDGHGPEREGSNPPYKSELSRPYAVYEGQSFDVYFSPEVMDSRAPGDYAITVVPLMVNSVDVVSGKDSPHRGVPNAIFQEQEGEFKGMMKFSMKLINPGASKMLPVSYLILATKDEWSICGVIDVYPYPGNYTFAVTA